MARKCKHKVHEQRWFCCRMNGTLISVTERVSFSVGDILFATFSPSPFHIWLIFQTDCVGARARERLLGVEDTPKSAPFFVLKLVGDFSFRVPFLVWHRDIIVSGIPAAEIIKLEEEMIPVKLFPCCYKGGGFWAPFWRSERLVRGLVISPFLYTTKRVVDTDVVILVDA